MSKVKDLFEEARTTVTAEAWNKAKEHILQKVKNVFWHVDCVQDEISPVVIDLDDDGDDDDENDDLEDESVQLYESEMEVDDDCVVVTLFTIFRVIADLCVSEVISKIIEDGLVRGRGPLCDGGDV
jgi:hypothetical protein